MNEKWYREVGSLREKPTRRLKEEKPTGKRKPLMEGSEIDPDWGRQARISYRETKTDASKKGRAIAGAYGKQSQPRDRY